MILTGKLPRFLSSFISLANTLWPEMGITAFNTIELTGWQDDLASLQAISKKLVSRRLPGILRTAPRMVMGSIMLNFGSVGRAASPGLLSAWSPTAPSRAIRLAQDLTSVWITPLFRTGLIRSTPVHRVWMADIRRRFPGTSSWAPRRHRPPPPVIPPHLPLHLLCEM